MLKDLQLLWQKKTWRLALLAALIATAAVAVSGGFGRAAATGGKLPISGPGVPLVSAAFSVTPLCAWTADVRPGQHASMAGDQRYLILRATVVNRAPDWIAMSAYLDKDVIWLPAGKGDPVVAERSQRADDATLGLTLGPGLPVTVDFIWELPAGMASPMTSTWGLFKRRHVARSYVSGEALWVQDGAGWKFEMPISDACPGATA